jgi:hypothetical protein
MAACGRQSDLMRRPARLRLSLGARPSFIRCVSGMLCRLTRFRRGRPVLARDRRIAACFSRSRYVLV